MKKLGIWEVVSFVVYLIAQVLIFKNLVLFNVGFCFLYVAFILFMPIETGAFLLIVMGFILGLAVDVFYDSLGLHAGALVFLAFIRNAWLNKIIPQIGTLASAKPLLATYGLPWLALYIVPLIFLHHTIIFFVEIGGFSLIGFTLLKIAVSTVFTALTIMLIQYLIDKRKRV